MSSTSTPEFNNIFDAMAYLLFEMRHSIEQESDGRPPRWLRMARARETQGENDFIGKGVKAAVKGFIDAVSWMSELVMDIDELLVQTDAAKALVEASVKFIENATSDEFRDGLEKLTGATIDGTVMSAINDSMASVNEVLDYIPEPGDVAGLGHELYRLLCLEQWPLPPRFAHALVQLPNDPSTGAEDHIHLAVSGGTGKLRLLQWAFELDYTIHGLGTLQDPESTKADGIVRLGSRRLFTGSSLASTSRAIWTRTEKHFEVFRFAYDTAPDDTKDIEEANRVLDLLGYYYYPVVGDPVTPEAASDTLRKDMQELERRLERFQMINDIAVTGQLDNETLNRLYNLDFSRKNLTRAKPFDSTAITTVHANAQRSGYFYIINHDAEFPHDGVVTDKETYPYYVASQTVPFNTAPPDPVPTGWLTDPRDSIRVPDKDALSPGWSDVARNQGFVGMRSRRLIAGSEGRQVYDFHPQSTWTLSEGEAASGNFFFCALGKQPWVPARYEQLDVSSDALFPPHTPVPEKGTFSQMYQWVDISPLIDAHTAWGLAATTEMYLSAGCLQRSLFRENNVDQGRIRLELYNSSELTASGLSRPQPIVGAFPPNAQSQWFPSSEAVKSSLHLSHSARKRNWVFRQTSDLKIPADVDRALVILEGKRANGRDFDAYFDNVVLRWEFRDISTS